MRSTLSDFRIIETFADNLNVTDSSFAKGPAMKFPLLSVVFIAGVNLIASPVSAAQTNDSDATQNESQPENAEARDTDNIADDLNAGQQLQQTFTLERRIDGVVVESDRRTVTFDRGEPVRETEAAPTTPERLRKQFDGEVLTRTEAFEEAKLDFVVADIDRNGQISKNEFNRLVAKWRQEYPDPGESKPRDKAVDDVYASFIAEIAPELEEQERERRSSEKFAFLAGASQTVSREDYIREYLLEFDSMDANKDLRLSGVELTRFRALNRGEQVDMNN